MPDSPRLRVARAAQYVIRKGKAKDHHDLAEKLGYTTTDLMMILWGFDPFDPSLTDKISELAPELNRAWLDCEKYAKPFASVSYLEGCADIFSSDY